MTNGATLAAADRRMRIGVVLPTFTASADKGLHAALDAEAAGLDGVFAYDHLWPMGQPGRPALSPYPLLGAVSAQSTRLVLGTLVARVGLVAPEVRIAELRTLSALAPGRVVAGIGTGDALSAAENRAFGIAFAPALERRAQLARVAEALSASGIPVWIGGGGPATNAVARALGVVVNLWNPAPDHLEAAVRAGPTSWGGTLPSEPSEAADLLAWLAGLGVTWAVVSWAGGTDRLVDAAGRAGIALGSPASVTSMRDALR